MCKVFYFHCKTVRCKESKHIVDEPQYCATYEKTFRAKTLFKKAIPKPAWIPTKSMVDTMLEPFIMPYDGRLYIHDEHYTPVDCKEIEYIEQSPVEECPFKTDQEILPIICQGIMEVRKREAAKKEEKERKKYMRFRYLN